MNQQSTYEVINGEVKETKKKVFNGVDQGESQRNLLASLTTFKLTLEEDEQASKSRLHLPYFKCVALAILVIIVLTSATFN
jgi:hypothetical protein